MVVAKDESYIIYMQYLKANGRTVCIRSNQPLGEGRVRSRIRPRIAFEVRLFHCLYHHNHQIKFLSELRFVASLFSESVFSYFRLAGWLFSDRVQTINNRPAKNLPFRGPTTPQGPSSLLVPIEFFLEAFSKSSTGISTELCFTLLVV